MDTILTQPTLFDQKHALAIRIWHWITFSLFTATIIVVLFANTLFDTGNNISMIQDQVKSKGGVVNVEQAKTVAHEYNDKLWTLHKLIGYFLCISLLIRIVIEFFLSKEEKFSSKIKNAVTLKNASSNTDANHYLWVKYGYLVFYFLFFLMASTGLILAYEDIEFLKLVQGPARSIHEFTQYCIYSYIILHLIGVIRSDVTEHAGIVSRMINKGNMK
ncbi:MAG: hypothetical protein NVSMB45_12570 [Ginsengibacter sp.]